MKNKAERKHSDLKSTRIPKLKTQPPRNWKTTDQEEIERRIQRAREECFKISNLNPKQAVFSNFLVRSGNQMEYQVEIRSLSERTNHCTCLDYLSSSLATCKHVEAVLILLRKKISKRSGDAAKEMHGRPDILVSLDLSSLSLRLAPRCYPSRIRKFFDAHGLLRPDFVPEDIIAKLTRLCESYPDVRISQEVGPWLLKRHRKTERIQLRKEYELKVQSGEWPEHETLHPLFPYQREGMLHLAFNERAMLADEMGLGKTIQAIAACALLHRLGKAKRVLVVTPASLKTEWEEQISRFTTLSQHVLFGSRQIRVSHYSHPTFFTIVNYEQVIADALDINAHLKPDVVILDEAQRIKNWDTLTARSVKRLASRYAFVLTGTPIENRIDELHSLMSFLDPSVLGSLFRFNREFYELDEAGRPVGYKNLATLHERTRPYILRRLKSAVETQLPERTIRTLMVKMTNSQRALYEDHEFQVRRLASAARRRALTQAEHEKLMREMAMCRMTCDTPYILDSKDRSCPKLAELEKILEECRENKTSKVLIFSEWQRMLDLVRDLCNKLRMNFAWHTGSVPQRRRRAEINGFKTNPACKVFLTTDSGSTGLNLQCANVVVNCDLPWNPAKLEQRIARAWRKNQTQTVTIFNLVTENSIEERMLETLAQKQALASGVLDLQGDFDKIVMQSGRQAFLSRLEQMTTAKRGPIDLSQSLPSDRSLALAQAIHGRLQDELVLCEELFPATAPHTVIYVVVKNNAAHWQPLIANLHIAFFGPGKCDPAAPTHLVVIDQSAHEMQRQLMEAGIIQASTRIARPLHPNPEPSPIPTPLSDEERKLIMEQHKVADRKSRVAQLLIEGDMEEEARPHVEAALLAFAAAGAIQSRKPVPTNLEEVFSSPVLQHHQVVWSAARHARSAPDRSGAYSAVIQALRQAMTQG